MKMIFASPGKDEFAMPGSWRLALVESGLSRIATVSFAAIRVVLKFQHRAGSFFY